MASSKSFKHYDSMYGFNSVIAKTVANVLSSFFPGRKVYDSYYVVLVLAKLTV